VDGYRVIAETIRARILNEQDGYRTGDLLPSEHQLAREFSVSRTTAGNALRVLVAAGLTEVRPGIGRVIGSPARIDVLLTRQHDSVYGHATPGADDFEAGVLAAGLVPGREPIQIAEGDAGTAAALGPGRILVRDDLRTINGRPHNRQRIALPHDLAAGTVLALPDNISHGVNAALAELGHPPATWLVTLTTVMPEPADIHDLRLPPGRDVLQVTRAARDHDGALLFTAWTTWPPGTRLILGL